MIQIVTKEFFYKNVGETNYDIYSADLENQDIGRLINLSRSGLYHVHYFIPDHGYFIYFNHVPKIAIPRNNLQPIDIEKQIVQGNLDFSHWELKILDTVDEYTLNEFERSYRAEIHKPNLSSIVQTELPKNLTCELYNTLSKETIRFNLKETDSYFSGIVYKAVVPQAKQVPYKLICRFYKTDSSAKQDRSKH